MRTAIQANLGRFVWSWREGFGEFRPRGKVEVIGYPAQRRRKTQAARLIVGFNVAGVPTWRLADVTPLVRKILNRQTADMPCTFAAQSGILRHGRTGAIVQERGAQVVIADAWNTRVAEFRCQMIELAKKLARRLRQEKIIVEIQRSGVSKTVVAVGP